MIKFLIIILGIIFPQISYSSTLQEPLQFLRKKYQAKIDTNPYFYFQYQRHEENNEACTSLDGIYCPQINNKTLITIEAQLGPEIMKLKQNLKRQIMGIISDMEERKKDKNVNQVYYTDRSRKIIDEKLFYEPANEVLPFNIFFNFEDFSVSKQKSYMNYKAISNFDLQKVEFKAIERNLESSFGKNPEEIAQEKQQKLKKNEIEVVFRNFYFPAEEMMDQKYKKQTQKEMDKKKTQTFADIIKEMPKSVYLQTIDKIQPEIIFSKPLRFKSAYLRREILDRNNKEDKIINVEGFLDGESQFKLEVKNKKTHNQWMKMENSYNIMIDKLVFDKNINIDNILLEAIMPKPKLVLDQSSFNVQDFQKAQQIKPKLKIKSIKLEDLQQLFKEEGIPYEPENISNQIQSLSEEGMLKLMQLKDYGELGDVQMEMQEYDIQDLQEQIGGNLKQFVQNSEELLNQLKEQAKGFDGQGQITDELLQKIGFTREQWEELQKTKMESIDDIREVTQKMQNMKKENMSKKRDDLEKRKQELERQNIDMDEKLEKFKKGNSETNESIKNSNINQDQNNKGQQKQNTHYQQQEQAQYSQDKVKKVGTNNVQQQQTQQDELDLENISMDDIESLLKDIDYEEVQKIMENDPNMQQLLNLIDSGDVDIDQLEAMVDSELSKIVEEYGYKMEDMEFDLEQYQNMSADELLQVVEERKKEREKKEL